MARSTSPAARRAPLPVLDPPGEWPGTRGFSTRPVALVALLPARQKYSQVDLPTISAPASSIRVTIVASISGTNPSRTDDPLARGIPATQTLSLTATRLPWSFPVGAPLIEDL